MHSLWITQEGMKEGDDTIVKFIEVEVQYMGGHKS